MLLSCKWRTSNVLRKSMIVPAGTRGCTQQCLAFRFLVFNSNHHCHLRAPPSIAQVIYSFYVKFLTFNDNSKTQQCFSCKTFRGLEEEAEILSFSRLSTVVDIMCCLCPIPIELVTQNKRMISISRCQNNTHHPVPWDHLDNHPNMCKSLSSLEKGIILIT